MSVLEEQLEVPVDLKVIGVPVDLIKSLDLWT